MYNLTEVMLTVTRPVPLLKHLYWQCVIRKSRTAQGSRSPERWSLSSYKQSLPSQQQYAVL